MDTDWCLSCGQHLPSDAPYCSSECLSRDRPSVSNPPLLYCTNSSSLHTLSDTDSDAEVVFHDIQDIPKGRWLGSDREGIRAWAANIPPGSSEGTFFPDVSTVSSRPSSPPPRRTPKLLLSNQRPGAPSLCMSTPHPAFPPPSRPIVTPQQSIASLSLAKSAGDTHSMSMSSLFSSITDSVVATPSSASVRDPICSAQEHKCHMPHMLDTLAIHVRSWVSPLSHPQPKYASSPRASKPADFNLGTFTKSHVAFHCDFDESGSDDYPAQDAWWASEGSIIEESSAEKRKPSGIAQPRGHHLECDHPAFHARGRKISRAFA